MEATLTVLTTLCGGLTTTSTSPPGSWNDATVEGHWIAPDTNRISEANVLIFGDAPLPLNDTALYDYLDTLKVRCQFDFDQDIVWITLNSVDRIMTEDFVH